MKTAITILLLFVSGIFAQEQKEPPKKPAPAPRKQTAQKTKPAPKAQPVTIPKDAREIYPGTFRWVDPKGQAWLYTKSPFGIMRGPEPKEEEPEAVPADWIVKDEGDSLTFERPWPFGGTKRWTRNKAELTDIEKAVWQRQQAKAQASR